MSRLSCKSRTIPSQSLRFDPEALGLTEFPRGFFRQDTVHVARRLLGVWLGHRVKDQWYGGRIVETEAYLGSGDAAAHCRGGRRTPRVEPMYLDGGHLYVFLVYGMHHCTNVVTRPEGIAEAVLLRAAEGPRGTPIKLLSGPAKLSRGLGVTTDLSGKDLLSTGNLRLFHNSVQCSSINTTRRIGVDYAGEAADWPLRFFDSRSKAVSGSTRLKKSAKSFE